MAEGLYVGGKIQVSSVSRVHQSTGEPARVIEPYPQNGTMGCYTASAAFIHTYLSGERIQPAELDAHFGRQPDEPIKAVGGAALWLLEKGHTITSYLQDSQPVADYLDGTVDWDTYLHRFAAKLGVSVEEAALRTNKPWLDASMPDHQANNAALESYRRRGQFTVAQEVITPKNIERRIGDTGIAIGSIQAFPDGPTHSQVLFKNEGQLTVYDPDIDESYIWPVTNLTYALDYTSPIAIWRA